MDLTYSAARRVSPPIILALHLLSGAMVMLTGGSPLPWLVLGAAVAGVLAMSVLCFRRQGKPLVDGLLYFASALAGGIVLGGWQAGFPANLPLWLVCVASVLLAAVAIVNDADGKLARSRNSA